MRAFKTHTPFWLLVAFVLLSAIGCATNPVTGKKQLSLISEAQEIQMGQQYDPQIVAEMGIYDNANLQRFLDQEGKKMAARSHRPDLPWTFRLVDSPVVNAFAVPGGFVYFTRGIMAHFNNEAQFAGVLGHEIGHVTARHTVRQQTRQTLMSGLAIGGMILSPELASQGQTVMQGLQLLTLKYGRDAERESDELGVEYSTLVGYDAREMAGFFSTLDRLSGGADNRVPTFLSTHPDPLNREQNVRKMAIATQRDLKAKGQSVNFEVGRESYLRRIDGMMYGEDPRKGFVEQGFFNHPDLKFRYRIPNNWRTQNTPTVVQSVDPNGRAAFQLRLAQGNDPAAAAREFATQNQLQVIGSSQENINGNPAVIMLAQTAPQQAQPGQQPQQQQIVRIKAGFISYQGNIYMLMGLAGERDFGTYERVFDSSIASFDRLTDPNMLNRQAERIRIASVRGNTTLGAALRAEGIPSDRIMEFSILNGMPQNQSLTSGTLIKVLGR